MSSRQFGFSALQESVEELELRTERKEFTAWLVRVLTESATPHLYVHVAGPNAPGYGEMPAKSQNAGGMAVSEDFFELLNADPDAIGEVSAVGGDGGK